MALLQGAAPGTDIVLTEERMVSSRAFANKIWNASRFLFLNMETCGVEPQIPGGEELDNAPLEDRWMFSRLNRCAGQVNRAIAQYRYHEAAQTLWRFFWHEFCDWYVEIKKLRFQESSGMTSDWRNILTVFETALRLLHPVMPFITEELWQRLAKGSQGQPASIALAAYPQPRRDWEDQEAERQMELLQEMVVSARNLRAQLKIDPKESPRGDLHARDAAYVVAECNAEVIRKLSRVQITPSRGRVPAKGVKRSTPDFDLVLDVPEARIEALRASLRKEVDNLERLVANSRRQLDDDGFCQRAPGRVVESIREKLAEYEAQLAKSRAALEDLA